MKLPLLTLIILLTFKCIRYAHHEDHADETITYRCVVNSKHVTLLFTRDNFTRGRNREFIEFMRRYDGSEKYHYEVDMHGMEPEEGCQYSDFEIIDFSIDYEIKSI